MVSADRACQESHPTIEFLYWARQRIFDTLQPMGMGCAKHDKSMDNKSAGTVWPTHLSSACQELQNEHGQCKACISYSASQQAHKHTAPRTLQQVKT